MEAVMTEATRLQMAQYPTITVLSLRDLVKYHSSHTRLSSLLPTPSPLTLLQFYLTREKPSSVFIDEVPLETQWDIIRWPTTAIYTYLSLPGIVWVILAIAALILTAISAISLPILAALFSPWSLLLLLPLFSPLLLRYTNQSSTYLPWLLASLSLASLTTTIILALLHTSWSLLPALGLLSLWPLVGFFLLPYSLASTKSLLVSLPSLLPPSATLWIALHSAPLTDSSVSVGENISSDDLEKWRRSLAPTFSSPRLRSNLRNTPQVTKVKQGVSGSFRSRSEALPTAEPPPAAPSLHPNPSTSPIHLPLSSPSQLQDAVAHTLTLLPTPLVILLQDPAHQQQVEAALNQENIDTFTYLTPGQLTACTAFLSGPRGALVTSGAIFSGMESVSVVMIRRRGRRSGQMERSDSLRAIERLVIIDTDPRDTPISSGTVVDSRFASCHLVWGARVYRCTSCPSTPLICPHCDAVCHQDCQKEYFYSRSMLQAFLPVTSCSYHTSSKCKLSPQSGI